MWGKYFIYRGIVEAIRGNGYKRYKDDGWGFWSFAFFVLIVCIILFALVYVVIPLATGFLLYLFLKRLVLNRIKVE